MQSYLWCWAKNLAEKEEVNTQNSQSLSLVEFEFLLLLAGEHPEYVLCKRESK